MVEDDVSCPFWLATSVAGCGTRMSGMVSDTWSLGSQSRLVLAVGAEWQESLSTSGDGDTLSLKKTKLVFWAILQILFAVSEIPGAAKHSDSRFYHYIKRSLFQFRITLPVHITKKSYRKKVTRNHPII